MYYLVHRHYCEQPELELRPSPTDPAGSGEKQMMVVIGCGNLNREDDGVGVVVARRLSAAHGKSSDRFKILDAGTDGMDIMFEARCANKLVIVDACASGSEPGAIFEAPGGELENASPPSFMLHDFRWDHALYAGRRIFPQVFPRDVTVFLVEAKSLGYGLDLSREVDRAANNVVAKIGALISAYVSSAP
jgi:hydrogenase maturation protease